MKDEIELTLGGTVIVVPGKTPITHYSTGGLYYPISIEFETKDGTKYKGWIREETDEQR